MDSSKDKTFRSKVGCCPAWEGFSSREVGALLGATAAGCDAAGWVGIAGVRLGALLGAFALLVDVTREVRSTVLARLAKSLSALPSVDGS